MTYPNHLSANKGADLFTYEHANTIKPERASSSSPSKEQGISDLWGVNP
ncbi:hypothetical protein KSF_025330 [Reticulibacter mediterranei]|uniref:Uncharacterized protein n=1 Tax=Reticulibacter mediterranei TaxID=2778369 RepID=A0A8J3N1S2_9CHLR|nr:hypothetical protein KSF_025330 [Reticulibacter mediterranei]